MRIKQLYIKEDNSLVSSDIVNEEQLITEDIKKKDKDKQ